MSFRIVIRTVIIPILTIMLNTARYSEVCILNADYSLLTMRVRKVYNLYIHGVVRLGMMKLSSGFLDAPMLILLNKYYNH